jgi:hypothetical protein
MSVRADLTRRLARLEQRRGRIELPKLILICNAITPERRLSLAPGERVVTDWSTDVDGFVVGSERITTQPGDDGRRCDPVITWSGSISWVS